MEKSTEGSQQCEKKTRTAPPIWDALWVIHWPLRSLIFPFIMTTHFRVTLNSPARQLAVVVRSRSSLISATKTERSPA